MCLYMEQSGCIQLPGVGRWAHFLPSHTGHVRGVEDGGTFKLLLHPGMQHNVFGGGEEFSFKIASLNLP